MKNQPWYSSILFAAISLGLTFHSQGEETKKELTPKPLAQVAIIVDDMGYSRSRGLAALSLPGNLTFAFIPNSPNARYLSQLALKQEKEIMLHAPMSNVHNFPLGESGLTEEMNQADFIAALNNALESVPHISGVNNHMGSLLTQKLLPMEWIMETLQKHELYFIDSWTTSQSVAWKTAQRHNIPSLKRDVFLDHDPKPSAIHEQFQHLMAVAKRRGYAVAIAHPYPETITFLQNNIEQLAQEGIELVSASRLVNRYSPNRKQIQAKM